jgi:integrin alpha FG-GAP repeat containing protein 1
LSAGAALKMVIPNSKLVINPGAVEDEWHKELYLHPGQWIPWVGLTVVGTMVALAGVVLVLHLNEKVPFFRLSVDDVARC